MFYLVAKTEDLSLGHSLSDNSKRLLWRGKDGARIIQEFFPQRPCSQNIKRLLLIQKKPRHPKLVNVVLFFV